MAITDIRKTVLEIINDVEESLGINPSASLNANQFTRVLLRLLNEIIAEIADSGDWKEQYAEAVVTAVSSVRDYAVASQLNGSKVHHIQEVAFQGQIAPLDAVDLSTINQLSRINSVGVPRQYCVVSVNASADPVIRVAPMPGATQAGKVFTVSMFRQPQLYTVASAAGFTPPFPATVLIKMLHARALLEENGGEPTPAWEKTNEQAEKALAEALNRYTTDHGTAMRLKPRRRGSRR